MNLPTSARSITPSASSSFKRGLTPKPSLAGIQKITLQTHQTTAEDDLFSITNEILSPTHHPELDPQISAWNHHVKYVPFRVRSPVKQAAQSPSQRAKQSLPSQLGERSEVRSELKAKLRHYEVNRSISLTGGTLDQASGKLTSEDCWREVETLDLDKLEVPVATKQQRMHKRTMILQPFYSMVCKRSRNAEKRAKSSSSQPSRDSSHSRNSSFCKDSSKFSTIAHTTQLKFPLISEEVKLQTRLDFYRQASISK